MTIGIVIALVAVAAAEPVRPGGKDLDKLNAVLAQISELREKDSRIGKGRMDFVEKQIGFRDEDGALLRPQVSDPDYSETTPESVARELQNIHAFDEKVAAAFRSLPLDLREGYDSATEEHKKIQEQLRPLCNEAIQAALKAYHIAPIHPSGAIANGPAPPRDDIPSFIGKQVDWNPVYQESRDPEQLGNTAYDGRVGISLEAFAYADRLGFVLYHESLHFDDLMDPAADVRNLPAAEVRHRTNAKNRFLGSVFVLTPLDVAQLELMIQRYSHKEIAWHQQMENGLNPWKKSDRAAFSSVAFRGGNYDGGAADVTLRDVLSLESAKEGSGRDFVDAYVDQATPILQEARRLQDQTDRQSAAVEEAIRLQKERDDAARRTAEARHEAARSCGLDELQNDDGSSYGFRSSDGNHSFYYHGGHDVGDDGARVAFMLARACLQQTRGYFGSADGPVGGPCDDGLDIMQRRWNDGNFRYSLILGTHDRWSSDPNSYVSASAYCVHYVVWALHPPVDMKRIRSVMQDFRRRAEREEAERRAIWASPGPSTGGGGGGGDREPRSSGGLEPPSGCHWLTNGSLAGCPVD